MDRQMEMLYQAYEDYYFFDPIQQALWSSKIQPTTPSSEGLPYGITNDFH